MGCFLCTSSESQKCAADVSTINEYLGGDGRERWEGTDKCKKRKGNCLPFSLPMTFPRSQELGWVLPFIEICPGSWTESDSRWARFKQFHCFIPWKLNNPASQSPVMSLGSHVLHCWDLSPVSVLATLPSSSESRHLCFWHPILQLLPWLLGLKLPVDDTCHPQSNVLPIWAFHYLGLLSFPGCVYPLEVLMSTVAWPMALLWAWHLSSCPAALALRLGLPSSLLSAVVWEVCARSCLIFSFHIVFLPYSDPYFSLKRVSEQKQVEGPRTRCDSSYVMVAKTSFGALEKDILVNRRCHLKNPNLTWLSKWSCVLGDGSDGRCWGSGSLSSQTFGKFLDSYCWDESQASSTQAQWWIEHAFLGCRKPSVFKPSPLIYGTSV